MKQPCIETGEGDPPVILVPGGLVGWLSWEPHAARLQATRRVLRVQLLNVACGNENIPLPENYSVRLESQALAQTIADHQAAPADIVAWSYGAEIALSFALTHPEQVRTLTLIEPPAVWVLRARGAVDDTNREIARRLGSVGEDVTEEDLELFATNVGFCPPGKSPRQMAAWPLWVSHRRSLRSSRHAIEHSDSLDDWRAFPRPVLLVKGINSAPFLHQIVDGLAAELPSAQVLQLPGGHAPQIVSMDGFLEHLAAFQKSC